MTDQFTLPADIQDKYDYLNELYPWKALTGQLIDQTEEIFGFCEWILPEDEKRHELAQLQYFAAIDKLYTLEKTHLITAGII